MRADRKYFVYIHRRATDGSIFYVGKGSRHRHKEYWGRSELWTRCYKKHGVIPEIVSPKMPEACAFTLEKILIGVIGRENLHNRADGGEGNCGYVMSDARKQAQREMMLGPKNWNWGKPKSPEIKAKISAAKKGVKDRPEVRLKKSIARRGRGNPGFCYKIWHFRNDDGREFIGGQYDFRMKYGLRQQSVSRLCVGTRPHHKGWRIVERLADAS